MLCLRDASQLSWRGPSGPREVGEGFFRVWCEGFRVIGFKGLGFKGLGFKGLGFRV